MIYTPSSYSPLPFFGLQYALCSQTTDIWVGHEPWSATVYCMLTGNILHQSIKPHLGGAMNPAGFSVFKTSVAQGGLAGWPPLGWQGQSSCGFSVGEPFSADQLWGTLDSSLACNELFYSDSLGEIVGNNCRLCVLCQLLEIDRNGVMICCCNQACDGLCVGMVFVCNSSMPDMPIHILSNTFTQIFHLVFWV